MTFSLAGRCDRTGRFGVVVTSSSPAVAARCAWARAGVGAACSQNVTDPALGNALLDALEAGADARQAMEKVVAGAHKAEFRQLSVVDTQGRTATYSGSRTLGLNRTVEGSNCVAAGNLLASDHVPAAMAAAFEAHSDADLGDRLLDALRAGIDAGGEEGPVQSCGMLIVDTASYPLTDLRIDWSEDPAQDLQRLWQLWAPQARDYYIRAIDPDAAPSYGVAGDL